jgi:hypothetical protein
MSLTDELKEWTDADTAALALGRALGLFAAGATSADARALLLTNSAAGNTVSGTLDRLVWLGVLERDDDERRYRSAPSHLHPLGSADDVPSLEAGPPPRAFISMAVDGRGEFTLAADRTGFRFLSRLFEEIANSGLDPGWTFDRGGSFAPASSGPRFSFKLVDAAAEEPSEKL